VLCEKAWTWDFQESELKKYNYVDQNSIVPLTPLKKALHYYDTYYNRISNRNFITILDYSQKSSAKRMYVIDMKSGAVRNFHVAHGKGSDPNHDGYADRFSNRPNSYASSLGFYLTAESYIGNNGKSFRLSGLEASNSNARARAIVVHSAPYAEAPFLTRYGKMGRSQGCPVVSPKIIDWLVQSLKNGSVFYVWHSNARTF